MKLSKISLAMLAASPMLVNASGLDRSGQSIAPFFEDGNYAEVSYTYTDPDIPGVETASGIKSDGGAAKDYGNTGAAIKFEPQKNVRIAIIYDEPLGVDYEYTTGTLFNGASAQVSSQAVTTLVGSTLFNNFWLYGGLSFEDHEAEVTLSGADFPFPAPYSISFEDNGIGYVGGMAYEIPDIALRFSATYRSKVKHRANTTEKNLPVMGTIIPSAPGRIEYDSPQSVNLEFQTGLNQTTLLMADMRWVNWKDFDIVTPNAKVELTNYEKDQFSVGLGLGKQLTNNFSGLVRVAYDTGTGSKNTSIFGPYEEEITLILGGKYSFNKNVDATLGVAYTMLGDGEVKGTSTPTQTVAKFDDGHAVSVGGKLGFHF